MKRNNQITVENRLLQREDKVQGLSVSLIFHFSSCPCDFHVCTSLLPPFYPLTPYPSLPPLSLLALSSSSSSSPSLPLPSLPRLRLSPSPLSPSSLPLLSPSPSLSPPCPSPPPPPLPLPLPPSLRVEAGLVKMPSSSPSLTSYKTLTPDLLYWHTILQD